MRSLAQKLTLAFLFVGVSGALLVSLFVGVSTRREFDQFVLDRYQVDLISELSEYYQTHGNWQGINAVLVRGPMRRQGQFGHVWSPATLADINGKVVTSGPQFGTGAQLSNQEMKKAVPVEFNGETVGWVLFDSSRKSAFPLSGSPELDFLSRINRAIVFSALGAVGLALILGTLLARTISRPVRELTAATQLVAQGELGHQVPVRGQDELGGLATSFNQMSSDLAQASASRRQMTADIAHELRTPLSVILGYAEGLREGKLQADEETFSVIHQETQHLNHLVDDLRTLALADAGELTLTCRPVAPRDLLARTATAYAPQAQRQDVALQMNVEEGLPSVEVDPDRFAQVLGNLVSNALRYTPAGGEITLMAGLGSQSVVLRVKDNGAGIDPGVLPYIFERFYKGDKSRHEDGESGLGLAIVKSIVEAHGGEILVESEPGQGAVFTIKIPRIQIQTRA